MTEREPYWVADIRAAADRVRHGLDALSLVHRIETMTDQKLDLSEDDLTDTRIEDVAARSTEQLEAL